MSQVEAFGIVSTVLFLLNWVVDVAGVAIAVVMFARYRHVASLLAAVGFGLPALVGPATTLARAVWAQEMGMGGILAVNAINSFLGLVASGFLVVSFWLALRRPGEAGRGQEGA